MSGCLPHLARLAGSMRAQPAAGDLSLYAVVGCRVHDFGVPPGIDGLLPRPLPLGAALYATLHDLIDQAQGTAESFVPIAQVGAQLGLTPDQARRQFYTPVLAGIGPAAHTSEVALYARYAGGLDYAGAIQEAFLHSAWRDLSWRSRAYLFNQGLPPALRLNWRSLRRIAQGQDRELARAICVLAALDLRLGLDLDALSPGMKISPGRAAFRQAAVCLQEAEPGETDRQRGPDPQCRGLARTLLSTWEVQK